MHLWSFILISFVGTKAITPERVERRVVSTSSACPKVDDGHLGGRWLSREYFLGVLLALREGGNGDDRRRCS